jgi:hypothetical protein
MVNRSFRRPFCPAAFAALATLAAVFARLTASLIFNNLLI